MVVQGQGGCLEGEGSYLLTVMSPESTLGPSISDALCIKYSPSVLRFRYLLRVTAPPPH